MTQKSRDGAGRRRQSRRRPAPSPAKPTPPQLVGQGLGRRLPAGFIDLTIVLVLMIGLAFAAPYAGSLAAPIRLLAVSLTWLYFFACEARWQTTPGKRLLGLRVVTLDGGRPDWLAHLVRALTRIPEALLIVPYVVSIIMSKRNQRIGDSVTDTLVVLGDPV